MKKTKEQLLVPRTLKMEDFLKSLEAAQIGVYRVAVIGEVQFQFFGNVECGERFVQEVLLNWKKLVELK